jgi:hypothetical protein
MAVSMANKNLIDEIEDVFITELGTGSAFILDKNLCDLGLTRESAQKEDVNRLVNNLVEEYNKVLGNHVYLIEKEIKKRGLN